MSSDDRFDELVVEWDRRQQQGENVSLQSLCEECPELLPKLRDYIASVSAADWLVEDPPLDADELLTSELVSTQTVEQLSNCVLSSGLITADELKDIKSRYSALIQDTISLAEVLIREQKLTRFQATRICGGNCTGHIMGDYVILDEIGAGGMGQVYKARHRRMKRIVAIKTLPPQTVNTPQAVARFQREVEAAAMLDHQNIVTAYDAGDADGTPFLVMMYVDGRDLMEIVSDQGPLPVHIAVDYLCQAATGLSYAHNLGVVHRDIKPDNLMLDNAGTVRILDMGLARLEKSNESAEFAETQAALTHAGTVMGTVDFMSPEQALDAQDADARADIYSLGCTLYFLLTSRAPYGGKSLMAKMLAHREDPIPALPQNVPAELNDAYERSMAKDIADRYRTMDDFLTDLRLIELPELIIPAETNTAANQETQLPGVAVPVPSQPSETPPHSIETAAVELAETIITEPDRVLGSQLEPELQSRHHSPSDLVTAPDSGRTRATPQESTSSNFSGRRRRLIGLIALALLAGGGLLLNDLILEYNTQNGTIEIHSNVADFEVEFDNQTEVVTIVDPIDNTKVKVDIPQGAKILRVRKGGFEAEVSDFVLNTLNGAVTVRFSSAVPHSEFAVASLGNHQAVADWARSVGGRVSISVDGEAPKFIRTADDLPERFELYGVSLSGCKTIKDDDIRRLKGVSLRELNVDDTSITNVGMAHLKGNDTLTKLSFIASGVDANCLTLFPNAPFQSLELSGLDDAGMAHIKNLKLLEYLHIEGLDIADDSVIDFGGMQNLKGLKFRNSTIPWAGFADLLLPSLTSLGFAGTEVNDEGLASIAKFLKQNSSPKLLDLSNTEVSDDGLKYLSDCQLRKLYLRDTNVSDKGLRHLTNLRSGALFLDRSSVTDAGLLQLPEVGSLDVSSPDVTVAGVAAYKKRFPKAQVHLITPE